MDKFSYTSLAGYARIVVILVGFGLVISGKMTLLNATALVTATIGLLGSGGLIAAKDEGSSELISQVTAKQQDGEVQVAISAQPEDEKSLDEVTHRKKSSKKGTK